MLKYNISIILICLCTLLKAESKNNNPKQLYQIYYDSILSIEGNNSKYLTHSFKLLELGSKLENDSLIANANFEISHSYIKTGNYSSALTYILKAAAYYQNNNKLFALSTSYNVIGTTYLKLGNHNIAIDYFRMAIEIHAKANKLTHLADDYINLGEAYRLLNTYDSAFHYFSLAYNIYVKENKKLGIAYAQCNLGLIYFYNNNTLKADSILDISFKYLRSVDDLYPECLTNYEIAKKAYENKNIKTASNYTINAKNIALNYGFKRELVDIFLLSSKINHINGDFQKAYSDLNQFLTYKDSLINDKTVSQMAEMRAEFEISQNDAELTYLKYISKARARLLFLSLFALVAIVVFTAYAIRQSRRRKEANYKLEEYNTKLSEKNLVIHNQLEEKDVLMKEIHHRVKNNLQIISSIMNLQSMRIDNTETLEIFKEMQRRILAISTIHQKLYQSESVSVINVRDYLTEIIESIHGAFNNDDLNVNYQISVENIELNVDIAVALGLIINELATNCYKYAFKPFKENNLVLLLNKTPDKHLKVNLHDNGPGMPDDFVFENASSLGLRMVNLLSRQQNGIIKITKDNGALFEIDFEGSF